MRKLKLPVPTTIITGSLGVGKTTAICNLIAAKPAEETWCVVVNEFGSIGIDAAALQSSAAAAAAVGGGVTVRQIAGGCMCCAQAGVLLPALAQVIRQTKPDRLLIEPSGLGHPGGLLDILQGPHLGSSLQLTTLICLVDLTAFDPEQLSRNATAWDQINVADILVGSKADAATPEAAAAFQAWAADELFPPKSHVLLSAKGQLDPSWLRMPRSPASAAGLLLKTSAQSSRARKQQQAKLQQQQQQQLDATQLLQELQASATVGANEDATPSTQQPQPGEPQRVLGQPSSSTAASAGAAGIADSRGRSVLLQHSSCGWVFHESDLFDREGLLQVLQALQPVVARVKGVFRVGPKQWVMPAAVAAASPTGAAADAADVRSDSTAAAAAGSVLQGGSEHACRAGSSTLQLQEVCYRGPSLVEVILPQDWQQGQQAAVAAAAAVAAVGGAAGAAAQQRPQSSSCSRTDGTAQAVQQQEQAAAASSLSRLALQDEQQSDAAAAVAGQGDVWLHIEAAFQACVQPC